MSTRDGLLYADLSLNKCQEAQAQLDAYWDALNNPRAVLAFQAGIDVCRGDVLAAKRHFAKAEGYGWTGWLFSADHDAECAVYQGVSSVLQQRPASSFPCAGEPAVRPPWPSPRQDPRLGV